ncbi:DUF4377 domain-containing protein [Pseudofulvibacter geojedonensis]|uniref:DUF4377 domain-containing protein n=1 Tax=Pseudofulvibacter geojedonensis TaxID=1123758 RepID=A0ABW3I3E9_9FLAO
MKKVVFILTLFSFMLMACKETKTVILKSNLVDCQGEGTQKCMQYKIKGEDNWQLFYGEIEGFTYEEGYNYELEVDIEKIDNPPADGSNLKYTLRKVLKKERDTQMALNITENIKKLNNNEQTDIMPLVVYDSSTRGFYMNLTVYNGGYITYTKQRNVRPLRYDVSKEDIADLKKIISTIDLKEISLLESPTNKRRFDGAPHTHVKVYQGKEEFKSSTFDGGHPPVELEALVNKMLSLQPKKQKNDD